MFYVIILFVAIAFFVLDKLPHFWASIILSAVTLLITVYWFPFGRISLPWHNLNIVLGLPLFLLMLWINAKFIVRNMSNLKYILPWHHSQETIKYIFSLSVNLLSCGIFLFAIFHGLYQMNPIHNFNSYFKERQHIVELIESGKLTVEESLGNSGDRAIVKLPQKYQGLSRGGYVRVATAPGEQKIIFTHSTIGFGDGSRDLVYYKSDNSQSNYPSSTAPNFRAQKLRENWFYTVYKY